MEEHRTTSDESLIRQWHGFKGKADWPLPKLVAKSDQANRADQGNTIKANEFLDAPEVLEAKINLIAKLIKKSKSLTAYTGAGLSKASGIPDYATKSNNTIVKAPKIASSLDALPTYAHHALTTLERAGHLKHWVQQNHDGLPQKAGFPQEKINEIHGAWFDPSNPVVQFSGSLRGDLFQWMLEEEEKEDMCLCLGTSLSGMNADRMACSPAKKSLTQFKRHRKVKNKIFGTVIINLQQTHLDAKCVVRVWATLDQAFQMLIAKLGLTVTPQDISVPASDLGKDMWVVPYDAEGNLDHNSKMVLNLKKGSAIKIPIEGAMNHNVIGKIVGKRDGNYSVELNEKKGPVRRLFGQWWVDAALRGAIPRLPIVNTSPQFVDTTPTITTTTTPTPMEEDDDTTTTTQQPQQLQIVQSHHLNKSKDSNEHTWGLSLAPGCEDVVKEVVWELHSSFRDPIIRCKKAPFEVSRQGWGTFTVKASILLKSGVTLKAKHELTFDGDGSSVKVTPIPLK